MFTSQTVQVLSGGAVAVLYAASMAAFGSCLLIVCIGRRGTAAAVEKVGRLTLLWLGFVLGQGVFGVLWLGVSLSGALDWWIVLAASTVGLTAGTTILILRLKEVREIVRNALLQVRSERHEHPGYFWVASGVLVVVLLYG